VLSIGSVIQRLVQKNNHYIFIYLAMPIGNRKKIEDLSSSVLSQFKKYLPSGNMKLNYLGILQSVTLLILMGKILSISVKLNFAN